jgi:hypothetical protein
LIGVSLLRPSKVFEIGFTALKERQMGQDTPEPFADEIPAEFSCAEQGLRRTVEKARTKEATR